LKEIVVSAGNKCLSSVSLNRTSNLARATYTCKILKLKNIDEMDVMCSSTSL
jgi:hypothetical protein